MEKYPTRRKFKIEIIQINCYYGNIIQIIECHPSTNSKNYYVVIKGLVRGIASGLI